MDSEAQIFIGNQIRKARKEKGYTQEELAVSLGVGSSHISNIERGKRNATSENICKLCVILDKNSDYFLTGSQYSNNTPERLIQRIKQLDEKKIKLLDAYVEMLENIEL